ncbi:MAG: LysR family transcriptional regulator [Pseudomonadota bacterium]
MRLELRDLQVFVALARHEHFTRAAEECGISQPALSLRIANLEAALGTPLVLRGARFRGFTEEGRTLLGWARRILAAHETMLAELSSSRGAVSGHVRLGVIPTALAFAARLAAAVKAAHPRVTPVVRAASASEIASGLATRRFDLGISYSGDDGLIVEPPTDPRVAPRPLYREIYVLRAPSEMVSPDRTSITWAEAAELPLAMLTPDMKNRQIIDAAFRQAGVSPRPIFETNSMSTLYAFLAHAGAATIVPANAAATPNESEAVLLGLVEPELGRTVAAVLPDAQFEPPAVTATLKIAEQVAASLPGALLSAEPVPS